MTTRWRPGRPATLAFVVAVALGPAGGSAAVPGPPFPAPLPQTTPGDTLGADTLVADSVAAEAAEEAAQDRARLDAVAEQELQAVFDRIEGLEAVTVSVGSGVAILRGRVLSQRLQEEAVRLAGATEGVVFVDDRTVEETNLRIRLARTMEDLRGQALNAVAYLPLLAAALLIFALFLVAAGFAGRWEAPYRGLTDNPFARSLVQQLVRWAVVLVGVVAALELLDATALVGAVLGAAGVLGIAAGFAFRNIVENHLAGAILSLRRPFSLDDMIVVGEHEGRVVRLTPRETILMTLEGNHLRIPNATVFNSVILNYTRNPLRRFHFDVAVGTGEELVRAQEVGRDALRALAGVVGDPGPGTRIVELGDSWVTVRYIGWVDQRGHDYLKVRSEAIRVVKEALDHAGVELPSPEYLVRMREAGAPPSREARGGPEPVHAPAQPPEDVGVDTALDRQVAEDRARAGEENLLDTP